CAFTHNSVHDEGWLAIEDFGERLHGLLARAVDVFLISANRLAGEGRFLADCLRHLASELRPAPVSGVAQSGDALPDGLHRGDATSRTCARHLLQGVLALASIPCYRRRFSG